MDISRIMPFALLIAILLVGLPVVLGRIKGKSPMEILFGKRVNDTLFEKREKQSGKERGEGKEQRNGSKKDLLDGISSLLNFSRRNHLCLVVPGTVKADGEKASLTAVLITRSRAVGFDFFGYGGAVQGKRGEADWVQTLNGERKEIPSPVKRNARQEEILRRALAKVGYPKLPVSVLGVFTTPGVQLVGCEETGCFTRKALLDELRRDIYLKDGGFDPLQVGTDLDKVVERPAREEKSRKKGKRKKR